MKIVFRVDSYPAVGMGHIVRSISIAKNLQVQNENIELVFFGVYDESAFVFLLN
jgi:spore coat polysaccharide biosynthesis predicted glycosyltransferase SpsG